MQIKKENWEKALQKLGNTDIKKASKEFYFTMKRLGGMGKSTGGIKKMTYKGLTANTEEGVANLMADSAQDTFKWLEDPGFNYDYFQKIQTEWENAQIALDAVNGNTKTKHGNEEEDNFTWNPHSGILRNKKYEALGEKIHTPNLTKHQAKEWGLRSNKEYKSIKEPLPAAPKLNATVDENWNEEIAHKCKTGKKELEKAYKEFEIEELCTVALLSPERKDLYLCGSQPYSHTVRRKLCGVTHLVSLSFTGEATNIHRLNLSFLVLSSLAPLKMKEVIKPLMVIHAQQYWFFTQLAVRTGLHKKIPLNWALQGLQILILHKGGSYEFP